MTAPLPPGTPTESQEPVEQPSGEPVEQPSGDAGNDDGAWDEAAAKRKFERMKADLAKVRTENAALKPLAAEAEKRRKGELSEAQRLAEEKAALEAQLSKYQADEVRRTAAEAVNLPVKFHKFVTASDPDEALAQAKELAAALAPEKPGSTKGPDLQQGNRGRTPAATPNANDLIRQMAGHA